MLGPVGKESRRGHVEHGLECMVGTSSLPSGSTMNPTQLHYLKELRETYGSNGTAMRTGASTASGLRARTVPSTMACRAPGFRDAEVSGGNAADRRSSDPASGNIDNSRKAMS